MIAKDYKHLTARTAVPQSSSKLVIETNEGLPPVPTNAISVAFIAERQHSGQQDNGRLTLTTRRADVTAQKFALSTSQRKRLQRTGRSASGTCRPGSRTVRTGRSPFFPFSSTSTLACYPALALGLKYQTDTRKHPRLLTPPIQSKSHTPP